MRLEGGRVARRKREEQFVIVAAVQDEVLALERRMSRSEFARHGQALEERLQIRAQHDWGRQFDPDPAESVLERCASLAPREMRRAWMTAFGTARLAGRATLSLDDLPEVGARRMPIGFTD